MIYKYLLSNNIDIIDRYVNINKCISNTIFTDNIIKTI